jgi:anti-sigma regulatory factor (Ser/Thr protein kinase)
MRRPAASRPSRRAPARRGKAAAVRPEAAEPLALAPAVRLRMPSRRDAVGPTIDRILEAVAPAGLDGDRLTDLAVALSEALSNAAVHGHGLDPRRRVGVAVALAPGCVVIDVSDSGEGFDARKVSDPTEPERQLAPSGRGVFLMRRLVDEVSYNAAGNRVRLTVRQHPNGDRGR